MSGSFSDNPTIKQASSNAIPEPKDIAEFFPQLEILDILGQGGMGVVYKARQKNLDRMVALKVLIHDPQRDHEFAHRFEREARSLAKLNHPNIVMIYDSGKAGDLYYFIMEYVDGSNLRQIMSSGSMESTEALAIVPQLCDALAYAHEEGIVHRDIKPENILIDNKGRVKVADFGIAKLLARSETDYTLTAPQQVIGTMHYMAPEQFERPKEVDHRADIYSLGVVLYEMLTGELPLGRFPLPSQKVNTDVRLDRIVIRALEKETTRRYQHVTDMKTDVQLITNGSNAAVSNLQTPSDVGNQYPHAPIPAQATTTGGYVVGQGKSPAVAYLLWCLCFFGACGIQRFYAGKWITGLIWVLTFGLFYVGQFIDLFLIPRMIHMANLESALLAQGNLVSQEPLKTEI